MKTSDLLISTFLALLPTLGFAAAPTQLHCEVENYTQGDGKTTPLINWVTAIQGDAPLVAETQEGLPAGMMSAGVHKDLEFPDGSSYELDGVAMVIPGTSAYTTVGVDLLLVSDKGSRPQPLGQSISGSTNVGTVGTRILVTTGNGGTPVFLGSHGVRAICELK